MFLRIEASKSMRKFQLSFTRVFILGIVLSLGIQNCFAQNFRDRSLFSNRLNAHEPIPEEVVNECVCWCYDSDLNWEWHTSITDPFRCNQIINLNLPCSFNGELKGMPFLCEMKAVEADALRF